MREKKTYDLDRRSWREAVQFGHITRDEYGFVPHCLGDWPGAEHVKVPCEITGDETIPDLSVGDAVLIFGDIQSWIVTQPKTELSGGFVAANAQFGIKLFLHSQVTAIYQYGQCIWKKRR
jgi:hypothetical protein